ncbi:hypothetical protein NIB75_06490 [Bacteroides uniformis]|nr:hypothetical protein [Bacteroides uniformis]
MTAVSGCHGILLKARHGWTPIRAPGRSLPCRTPIRFHGCTAIDDSGRRLDKYQSLAFLSAKAEEYKNGEGWRLLAVLEKNAGGQQYQHQEEDGGMA